MERTQTELKEKVAVFITPTNCCNLVCRCPNSALRYRNFIDPELACRLLEEIASDDLFLKTVTWSEFGESFLHKDNFDFIRFAKDMNLNIYLLTNFTLLSSEEIATLCGILSSGDIVCVNLDWGKRVFESIRKNTSYEKKVEDILNLILVNKNKDSSRRFKIEVWSIDYDIVTEEDKRYYFEEIKYLSEVYKFSYSIDDGKGIDDAEVVDVSFHRRAESKWKNFIFIEGKPLCAGLYSPQIHIHPNGKTAICCHDWNAEAETGHIGKQTLREIWESSQRKELENSIYQGSVKTGICRKCLMLDK